MRRNALKIPGQHLFKVVSVNPQRILFASLILRKCQSEQPFHFFPSSCCTAQSETVLLDYLIRLRAVPVDLCVHHFMPDYVLFLASSTMMPQKNEWRNTSPSAR